MLFDGKTTKGWRAAVTNKTGFPDNKDGWAVEDGKLIILAGGKGGDIVTLNKYGDFELRVEFMVKEHKSNSGIKYYVSETKYRKGEALGIEFQTENADQGDRIKVALASAYDILQPTRVRFVLLTQVTGTKFELYRKTRLYSTG